MWSNSRCTYATFCTRTNHRSRRGGSFFKMAFFEISKVSWLVFLRKKSVGLFFGSEWSISELPLIWWLTDCWVDYLGDLTLRQSWFGCVTRYVLGLNSSCRIKPWWLRPGRPRYVIEDLFDYAWFSDPKAAPSDDTHRAATLWVQGHIKPIAARSKILCKSC